MKILWLSWKDMSHPQAGGAELVAQELGRRLAAEGHELVFLCGGFAGGAAEESRDGFRIIRVGNRFTVYWQAYRYYQEHFSEWPELVIDEVNTIPFFAKYYVEARNILLVHQLAREIWFYEIFFPLSLIGYLLEPLYLRLLADRQVVTVSHSSKQDLLDNGFKAENVSIISEGIEFEPLSEAEIMAPLETQKYSDPTILAFGSVRAMKRTRDIFEAFCIAKADIPTLRLVIAGSLSGRYAQKLKQAVEASPFRDSIELMGRVNDFEKRELMRRAHILAVTSVKEGWCLVVSEAASQGTPAVVYDTDGLRDSVRNHVTGQLTPFNTPDFLASEIISLLGDRARYMRLRHQAWDWSRELTFERAYADFKRILFDKP